MFFELLVVRIQFSRKVIRACTPVGRWTETRSYKFCHSSLCNLRYNTTVISESFSVNVIKYILYFIFCILYFILCTTFPEQLRKVFKILFDNVICNNRPTF